jgi:hypothetical protein
MTELNAVRLAWGEAISAGAVAWVYLRSGPTSGPSTAGGLVAALVVVIGGVGRASLSTASM